jgi:hypothetical protein
MDPNIHIVTSDVLIDGAILTPSDHRLKNNIVQMPSHYNELLMQVEPKCFSLNRESSEKIHFGFIAQELEQVIPNLVATGSTIYENNAPHTTPYKSVNYLEFIPLLLLKIQDLQSQVNELKLLVPTM